MSGASQSHRPALGHHQGEGEYWRILPLCIPRHSFKEIRNIYNNINFFLIQKAATSFLYSKFFPIQRLKADKVPHLIAIVCTNPIFEAKNHFEQNSCYETRNNTTAESLAEWELKSLDLFLCPPNPMWKVRRGSHKQLQFQSFSDFISSILWPPVVANYAGWLPAVWRLDYYTF